MSDRRIQQMDFIDLLVNVLMEHEKVLDGLVGRLERAMESVEKR